MAKKETIKFYGKAHNHKFAFDNREYYDGYMEKFPDDTPLEMTVKRKYKRRTSGQVDEETNFNGYLWGIVYNYVAEEIGELDLDYVHYWMQISVGNFKMMPDGTKVPLGTSEMSGGEFADYCGHVRTWAATPGNLCEYGINIPEPNE